MNKILRSAKKQIFLMCNNNKGMILFVEYIHRHAILQEVDIWVGRYLKVFEYIDEALGKYKLFGRLKIKPNKVIYSILKIHL